MVVREGLKKLLEAEDDLEVIGEAETGRQAVEMTMKLRPAVVVPARLRPAVVGRLGHRPRVAVDRSGAGGVRDVAARALPDHRLRRKRGLDVGARVLAASRGHHGKHRQKDDSSHGPPVPFGIPGGPGPQTAEGAKDA